MCEKVKVYLRGIIYPPGATPLRWKELSVLLFGMVGAAMTISMLFPFLPAMVKGFGESDQEAGYSAGLIASAMFVGRTISSYFWGLTSDKVGRRPVIIVNSIAMAASTLLFGFSKSVTWAIVARFLVGLGNGLMGTAKTVISEVCDDSNQALGVTMVTISWTTGLILGPAIGGYLAELGQKYPDVFPEGSLFHRFAFLMPNLINAVVLIVAAVAAYFALPETLRKRKKEPRVAEKEQLVKTIHNGTSDPTAKCNGKRTTSQTVNKNSYATGVLNTAENTSRKQENSIEDDQCERPSGKNVENVLPDESSTANKVLNTAENTSRKQENSIIEDDQCERPSGKNAENVLTDENSIATELLNTEDRSRKLENSIEDDQCERPSDTNVKNMHKSIASGENALSQLQEETDTKTELEIQTPEANVLRQRQSCLKIEENSLTPEIIDKSLSEVLNGGDKVTKSGNQETSQTAMGNPCNSANSVNECATFEFENTSNGELGCLAKLKSSTCCTRSKQSNFTKILRNRDAVVAIATYSFYSFSIIGGEELFNLWVATRPSSGGLGFSTDQIGTVLLIVGIVLTLLQPTFLPKIEQKIGAIHTFQIFAIVALFCTVVLPCLRASYDKPTALWTGLMVIMLPLRMATTGGFLATFILINNSVTSDMLGTVNGLAMSTTSAFRSLAPTIGGSLYAWSISSGYKIGFPFNVNFTFIFFGLVLLGSVILSCILSESLNKQKTYEEIPQTRTPTTEKKELTNKETTV